MPKHPEYIYRLSDEWEGWNDFFGISEDSPEFMENLLQDVFEDRVFKLLMVLKSSPKDEGPDTEH